MLSKKLILAFAVSVAGINAFAATANGVLQAVGGTAGFDFRYPSEFIKQIPAPGMAPIKLQSRFTWGSTSSMSDHAIVAYVQGANPAYLNSEMVGFKSALWRYGAGAYVASNGLNLELWFNPTTAVNGSAYVWNWNTLCGGAVNAAPINVCVGNSYSPTGSYVEPLPANWSFVPGDHYWVKISLTPSTGDWLNLYAELIHQSPTATRVVQRAQIGFQKSAFLPLSSSVSGAVARAPGSGANITWIGYDYF